MDRSSVADDARGGVVFDVDGTLLAAWWEAFRERGHDIRCADIHRALGTGSAELIERVLGKPDPSVSAAHSRHYAPYLGRIRPLPGAADLLGATARFGLDVMLATSAKSDEVDLMLDALGAGSAVSAVVSSGDVERAKPDPGIVQKALDQSGIDPGGAVMVGDTVWDVLAAERAGIRCIGLLCGGIAAEQLREAGAAAVYADPAALLGDIHASPIGQLRTRLGAC